MATSYPEAFLRSHLVHRQCKPNDVGGICRDTQRGFPPGLVGIEASATQSRARQAKTLLEKPFPAVLPGRAKDRALVFVHKGSYSSEA